VATTETTGQKQRGAFRKGESGNPAGRPRGARNRATLAAEVLLDGEAERLTRACITAALGGDTTAQRLCMERLLPARRDRPVLFALSPMSSAADACVAIGEIVEAVAAGDLTPSEATAMAGLVDVYVRALETRDLEVRVQTLEQRTAAS
jgi:hypothetical protein